MTLEIQWKCKDYHPGCEAIAWRDYKVFSESDAKDFMETKAPNSRNFDYRIKPDENPVPAN